MDPHINEAFINFFFAWKMLLAMSEAVSVSEVGRLESSILWGVGLLFKNQSWLFTRKCRQLRKCGESWIPIAVQQLVHSFG